MQVTQTSEKELRREFKIVVDAGDIEEKLIARLKELGQNVRMPGFRPGKVPVSLLRKQYGKAVLRDVIDHSVAEGSQKVITDEELQPASQPHVTIGGFDEGADLEFSVAVDLMPKIDPGDFRKTKLTRYASEVGDADVEDVLKRMAKEEAEQNPVNDRPAQAGDVVVIDFIGRIDGEAFEGGAGNDFPLELGSGRFIPGFEDNLAGSQTGEHKTFELNFPDGYPKEELARKTGTFDVDVKEIKELVPATVDQAFAEAHGHANLDALHAAVRERIGRQFAAASRAKLKRALLDRLAEEHDFPVPQGMVEREFETIWSRITEELDHRNTNLADSGQDEEALRSDYRGIAERRVRLGLLLGEVGRINNITVEPDEIKRAVLAEAMASPGREKEVVEMYRDNAEALQALRGPIFEDKVVDFILEMATIEDKEVSAQELLRDPDADNEGGTDEGEAAAPV